jgi:preprotein translocase subunit YajC
MSSPTLGITILIVLVCAVFFQLLFQGSAQKKRHQELREKLDRLEASLTR